MSQQRLCVVVPTLNHVDALDAILTRTTGRGLPTIVVDDGSRPEVGERIRDVCERHTGRRISAAPVQRRQRLRRDVRHRARAGTWLYPRRSDR